jgi:serine/threonine-protein kinase
LTGAEWREADESASLIQSQDATCLADSATGEMLLQKLPGDRYRVLGEIARGGMGVILRVHDGSFDRPLAIKVLLTRPGAGAERRFLDEARVSGQLQHPGIPPVHELGRLDDGRPFFSMKLIEGNTLADLLRRRSSPSSELPRFLKVFEQVAQTLAYAHSQRVIHRDLKPLNIMVGAFGEVQVMDWGVAKRLLRESALCEASSTGAPETAGDHSAPSADTVPANTGTRDAGADDSQTQAGEVLGTISYMAPEQARGEVASLDERCDVFGLGAILCAILTGNAPYATKDKNLLWKQAREGDLGEAWARLEACGADPELVTLARSCLSPRKEDRPRHGGAVAEAVTRHLASVEQRLQQARVARAEAEVKAGEERKRRRLAVGLAAAVVVLLAGVGAASLWYQHDQGRRQAEAVARREFLDREVGAALDETERLRGELNQRLEDEQEAAQLISELDGWRDLTESAQGAWTRADRIAAGGREMLSPKLRERLADASEQVQADERDRQLAVELDRIRLEVSTPINGNLDLARGVPLLAGALRGAGFDVNVENPERLADRIRASAIHIPLVAALDFLAQITADDNQRKSLLEVARRADPDLWRDGFRQPAVWDNASRLKSLAADVDCRRQTPQILSALAVRVGMVNGAAEAAALVRRALLYHPRDFWLLYLLGVNSSNPAEQIGAFRATLAARPRSAIACYSLGVVHYGDQQLAEALACYRKAVELDDNYVAAHSNLGLVLSDLGQNDEAVACFRRALELDPRHVLAQINLGAALQTLDKPDAAEACYRAALEIEPRNEAANNNLGTVLRLQGRLAEAIAYFRQTIEINPRHAMAWCNLGHTLRQQGNLAEALPALRQGHECGSPGKGWSYPSGQWVHETERLVAAEQKLPAILSGEISPADAGEQLVLAELCQIYKKRYTAAARFYAAALVAEPSLALDASSGRRYNAACAAVQAAAGRGVDAGALDDMERMELRRQALAWLQADLATWSLAAAISSKSRVAIVTTLEHWQNDPDLADVRDAAALDALPPDEQKTWQRMWADVARVLRNGNKSSGR